MSSIGIEVGEGFCFGIGGTNSRTAHCVDGDIVSFQMQDTPASADDFFKWASQHIMEAAEQGAGWAVAGFPGPVEVTDDSFKIGPFTNIPGLKRRAYDLRAELEKSDSAVGDIFEQGFRLIAVNDGDLAAHAAATRIGEGEYDKAADIILGTGVGGAVVARAQNGVYHSSREPFEVGHVVLGEDPRETFENTYSGSAIEASTGMKPEKLPADHPVWDSLGRGVGKLATLMSLVSGAELVVPSGSVGVHRFQDYRDAMLRFMEQYNRYGSPAQQAFEPLIQPVPTAIADEYELFGAEGVILDALSQEAATAA